ncbi:hypothetical protein N7492_002735 [Penicillium capsulatum]|uniref:Transmembrane protein n=1 Tax=Penicillium capsulatum TaxID=69766 RepID=A0A9W9IJ54_9EURO|nr:hypothetical protein N7492_002735 [Penicillium capsulatum]KAJ6122668.1 hypothetical protein N7512_005133 [Penicillium capsulatum]
MTSPITLRALVWAALLAALVPCSFAFRYNQSRYGDVHPLDKQDIYSAEAEAMIKHDKSEEGEDHGDIGVPNGAMFTSFNVNEKGDEEIAGFISKDLEEKTIEHLFIVLHGKLRDGNNYWKTFNTAINKARKDNVSGTDRKMAVLVPQFFSTEFNSGQYKKNQLAWDDLNAWQPGGQATHPTGTSLTSFDVLDGLIKLHSDKERYPSLKNVTVVGHGGGGQLAQRYSALGNDPLTMSTSDTETSTNSCKSYNTWRYGFDKFPGTGGKRMTPKEYFTQYISRDVVSIVGLQDTGSSGDTSCMGIVQGGVNRRARNLIWFRYINTLARTDEDLDGFPGSFKDLPDWSDAVNDKSHLRLIVVEDADHDAEELFQGDLGQGALFHDGDIDGGWRPNNRQK